MTDTLNPVTDAAASAIDRSAADVVADLTLAERASLTSGASLWCTKAVERVGIPPIRFSDGPHGLRGQPTGGDHLGIGHSLPATCFPPAVALGSSWDPDLLAGSARPSAGRRGRWTSGAARPRHQHQAIPAVRPQLRIPLGGPAPVGGARRGTHPRRAVAGRRGGAEALRSQQPGDRPDTGQRRRRRADPPGDLPRRLQRGDHRSAVDRDVLVQPHQRDVRLRAPMAADRGAARRVGLRRRRHLGLGRGERAGRGRCGRAWIWRCRRRGATDMQLVTAIEDGSLEPEQIDTAARRESSSRRRRCARPGPPPPTTPTRTTRSPVRSPRNVDVLLKNDGRAPAGPDRLGRGRGRARPHTPLPGRGQSQIVPTRVDEPLAEYGRSPVPNSRSQLGTGSTARCRRTGGPGGRRGRRRHRRFLGLPALDESEGYDRTHLDLPAKQLASERSPAPVRGVVVLANGGVVRVSGGGRAAAMVEGWLLGQAGGGAIADVLFGVVNPSGRLAETVPVRLADTPSYLTFPGEFVTCGTARVCSWATGTTRRGRVAYPFGHGLSYTTFDYRGAWPSRPAPMAGWTCR